jgi:hypothetical protein
MCPASSKILHGEKEILSTGNGKGKRNLPRECAPLHQKVGMVKQLAERYKSDFVGSHGSFFIHEV